MKSKKYRIKIIVLCFAFFGTIYSSDKIYLEKLFKEAIEFYNKTDFVSSEEGFLKILEILKNNRKISFEIFYNLGNCYYRQNRLGLARYYYELAKKVNYHNPDVNYNLNFIKKITNNTLEDGVLDSIINILSFKELLILTFVFNFMFFSSLIFGNFINMSVLKWIKRISLAFFVTFLFSSLVRYTKETQNIGIVVETTSLFSAPEENEFVKSVGLSESKKVVILSEKDNYFAVYIPQDKIQGWVKKDKVKLLKIYD
ncbi:MAG: tetratricopeptide repeat protein [Endomicrobiia bacterium]